MRTLKFAAIAVFAALSAFASHAQVYRCVVAGQQVYQQQPCVNTGGTGTQLKIQPDTPSIPIPRQTAPVALPQQAAPTAPTPSSLSPVAPSKSLLDVQADQCLDWYRPKLRDPAGAYYRNPLVEKGVLSLTIHATNGYGGYVPKQAACEFKSGQLDESWTKIHSERRGW